MKLHPRDSIGLLAARQRSIVARYEPHSKQRMVFADALTDRGPPTGSHGNVGHVDIPTSGIEPISQCHAATRSLGNDSSTYAVERDRLEPTSMTAATGHPTSHHGLEVNQGTPRHGFRGGKNLV